MIATKKRLVVTFYTTAGAMAMEKLCARLDIPGKLIPVPRSLTADCGMAWRTDIVHRAALEGYAEELEAEGFYELEC